jgi:hypothetical protein
MEPFEFDPSKFVESFVGVCREVIIRPRMFFQNLPREGMLGRPFVFLLVCVFFASLFMANYLNSDYRFFVLLVLANCLSAFIVSALLHGLATKVFGGQAPFAATFRIIAYSSIMDIVAWIPIWGTIASFYGLYLVFLGLQEIHQLKSRQAGFAVIIITALAVGMGIMVVTAGKDYVNIPELAALLTDANE